LFIGVDTTVQFSKASTLKLESDIESAVINSITNFSETYLEAFGKEFRYSKFIKAIDDSDPSINSNDTDLYLVKRVSPTLYTATSYVINFLNELSPRIIDNSLYTITSTHMVYLHTDGKEYDQCHIRDDGKGILQVLTYVNNILTILNPNLGTVNYATGELKITNLKISSFSGNYLEIIGFPNTKDIYSKQNTINIIDPNRVNVTAVSEDN